MRIGLSIPQIGRLADRDAGADRAVFTGSPEQLAEDVSATEAAGAHELILDFSTTATSTDDILELADAVVTASGRSAASDHGLQPSRLVTIG